MELLAGCDTARYPFPCGNMNDIVDMASLSLFGVCLSGPSVSEHIDEGMFGRLGLPDWLVATTSDAHVAAALRLTDRGVSEHRG